MDIFARDFGVEAGKSVGREITALFQHVSTISGQKTVIFDAGDYFISSDDIEKRKIYITNTIGKNEWRSGEEYQMKKVAIMIENVSDVHVVGNGAKFILDGVMTNMAIMNSQNVTIDDITFDTINPDYHELKITNVGPFSFEFEVDKESQYKKKGNKYYFVGKDYELDFLDSRKWAWWTNEVKAETPNNVRRVMHPLWGAIRIKELAPHKFRAITLFRQKIEVGTRYYVYDVRRKNVGIFIDTSKDITLSNVTSHFSYSLGIVGQNSENITLSGLSMVPSPDNDFLMSCTADFVHLCMCRGHIEVRDSKFEGAGDDCLNVHGIHFGVVEKRAKSIVVRFMHPQAYGFNPLRVGDEIEFVDKATLLPHGKATITSSKMLDEYNIELGLDDMSSADTKYVIEDISACPSLTFENNYLNRIITRGILITTRGEVVVKNNVFNSNTMHSILFSDDANNWYESGRCEHVLIEGNTFNYCPMYDIYIKPENTRHEGYVHGDFVIKNNKFNTMPNGGIYAKSTRSVTILDNENNANMREDFHDVGKIIRE